MKRPSFFYSVKDRSAKTLTPEALAQLQRCSQTVEGMTKIDALKAAGEDIRPGKEMLAVVTWGARYEEGSPRGTEGAQDTGLFFIDCDHLKENPTEVYYRLLNGRVIKDETRRQQVEAVMRSHVKGAHVTPSGEGLRIILTKLLPDQDNDANIEAFIQLHAADPAIKTVDKKVKDIGHPSFVPCLDYWIYFDNAILADDGSMEEAEAAVIPSQQAEASTATDEERQDYNLHLRFDAEGHPVGSNGKVLQTEYRGHQLTEIRDNVITLVGGKPSIGDRNRTTYKVLSAMAPIVDYKEEVLQTLIPYWGLTWDEAVGTAKSAAKRRPSEKLPYLLWKVLHEMGIDDASMQVDDQDEDAIDDAEFMASLNQEESNSGYVSSWGEGMPPLAPVFKQWIARSPKDYAEMIYFTVLFCMSCLASKLRARYWDDRVHSPSLFVTIEGDSGTGKSTATDVCEMLFEPIAAFDAKEVDKQVEYDLALKRSRNKAKQPEDPLIMQRLLDPTISVTAFLKQNYYNKGLHAITVCPEVDTMVKQHSRGAWGQLSDLYRLAYDNTMTGQKFLSENSFSGRAKVYYNLLVTGTPVSMGKFFRNVEDGLVNRTIPIVIPDQFAAKNPKWKPWTELQLKIVHDVVERTYHELSMDEEGHVASEHFMELGWLNDAIEDWLEEQRLRCLKEMSRARDTYRRRAANNGFRAGMVIYYLLGEKPTADIRKKVIANALYVCNYTVESLLARYGKATEAVLHRDRQTTKTGNLFDMMPDTFKREQLKQMMAENKVKSSVRDVIWKWKSAGLIKVEADGSLTKQIQKAPKKAPPKKKSK